MLPDSLTEDSRMTNLDATARQGQLRAVKGLRQAGQHQPRASSVLLGLELLQCDPK